MKKITVLMVSVVLMSVSLVQANVYVNWYGQGGFYFNASGGASGILGSGTGNSTLAQLMWSPDILADLAVDDGLHYAGGNDIWLDDFTLTEGGNADEWAWWSPPNEYDDGGVLAGGGYVYARIFQDDTVTSGDWYYQGDVVSANNLNPTGAPPDTAQGYELNSDLVNGNNLDNTPGHSFQVAAVPEPGTIMLFALGLATLVARRKRR